jgi:hypothetical protein
MSLISTLHPTYAFFHNPWELGNFMVDLDRFARMIRGELEPGPKKINIHPNARDVAKFHKWALAHPDEGIALDIETAPERAGKEWGYTGKDPTRCKLKVIGIGNCEVALSYKWRNNGSRIERAFRALLEDDRVLKILHNGDWFDLRVLDRYALPVRSTFDTRDALCPQHHLSNLPTSGRPTPTTTPGRKTRATKRRVSSSRKTRRSSASTTATTVSSPRGRNVESFKKLIGSLIGSRGSTPTRGASPR